MSEPTLFLGCISGTSVDGLDIALLDFSSDRITTQAARTIDLPVDLRQALLALGQPGAPKVDDVGEAWRWSAGGLEARGGEKVKTAPAVAIMLYSVGQLRRTARFCEDQIC